MAARPCIVGVLETAIYVEDVARAESFYAATLGLATLFRDDRLCALDCGPRSVLLLFKRGSTSAPVKTMSGEIPPHEATGRIHFALAIRAVDLEDWNRRLAERGVAIEGRMDWPRGGKSIYFRDPDANLVELATPGLWANY